MKKTCTFLIALLFPLCAAAQQNWKAIMRYDKQAAKTALAQRLSEYAAYDTQANPQADKVPSSKGQSAFAKALAKELKNIGASNVKVSKNATVTADIPATTSKPAATIALVGFLDTTPLFSTRDVKTQLISKYTGGDIVLDSTQNIRLIETANPHLLDAHGHDIITASGNTTLGANAKAGIAVIMTMADYLLGNPSVEHGPLKIVFIADHNNRQGLESLDTASLGAHYAYIVNGADSGEMTTENFSERSFTAIFEGKRQGDLGQAMHSAFADNLLMASDFHTLLPRQSRPETTANRRGFIWVDNISTQGDRSEVSGYVRAFSQEDMQSLSALITQAFNTVKAMNPKRTGAELNWQDGLQNAKDSLPLQITARLEEAMRQEDITPKPLAERGVNAAAVLNAKGLPAIGVFSGVFNPSSTLEYADVDVMESALRTLISLSGAWASPAGQP